MSASVKDQLTRMSESINIAEYIHAISASTKPPVLLGANTAVIHPGKAARSVSITDANMSRHEGISRHSKVALGKKLENVCQMKAGIIRDALLYRRHCNQLGSLFIVCLSSLPFNMEFKVACVSHFSNTATFLDRNSESHPSCPPKSPLG